MARGATHDRVPSSTGHEIDREIHATNSPFDGMVRRIEQGKIDSIGALDQWLVEGADAARRSPHQDCADDGTRANSHIAENICTGNGHLLGNRQALD